MLLTILSDILDLSKVEAGQMELDRTTFSVEQAVTYALAMVRERALNHRIALRTTIAPEVSVVHADELRIWLGTIDPPEAGVSGMTYWTHLTRDHSFDPLKIEGLAEPEQAKLHAAAHYGY